MSRAMARSRSNHGDGPITSATGSNPSLQYSEAPKTIRPESAWACANASRVRSRASGRLRTRVVRRISRSRMSRISPDSIAGSVKKLVRTMKG